MLKTQAWQKLKWPLLALALVMLFNLIFTPGFFHLEFKDGRLFGSLVDVFNRAAPVMLLSLGMTLVIATGGVDLSVGAVMAIAGATAALLITKQHLPVAVIIAIALGAACISGIWNGWLVGFLGVPPIVATLILMVSGRGIAQLLTGGQIITFHNQGFEFIARGKFLALPFPITLTVSVFILLALGTKKTAAGLFIEATGDNETASRCAGVNTRLVKMIVYTVCGMCAGLAGLIPAADISAADANHAGEWLELDAILATVIGGTALQGGRFFLAGSLVGAILIQTVTTTILTRGVRSEFTLVVKALVVIAVCLLQSEKFRQTIGKIFPKLAKKTERFVEKETAANDADIASDLAAFERKQYAVCIPISIHYLKAKHDNAKTAKFIGQGSIIFQDGKITFSGQARGFTGALTFKIIALLGAIPAALFIGAVTGVFPLWILVGFMFVALVIDMIDRREEVLNLEFGLLHLITEDIQQARFQIVTQFINNERVCITWQVDNQADIATISEKLRQAASNPPTTGLIKGTKTR